LVNFFEIPGMKEAHKAFLFEEKKHCLQPDDLLVGPYIEGFLFTIFYNRTTAEKLGISVPEKRMMFNDFLRISQQIQKYNQTATEPVSLFVNFKNSSSITRLAYNLLLSMSSADRADSEEPILCRILEAFEQLGRSNPLPNNTVEKDRKAAAADLVNGRTFFLIDATWFYNTLQAAFPEQVNNICPIQMPGFEKQNFYIGGFLPVWAVMKNSPAREAGIRLLQFWSRPDIAEKWVYYTKCPTALAGNIYDPEYGKDPFAKFQKNLTAGRTPKPDVFMIPTTLNPIKRINPFLTPLLREEITASEALEQIKGIP
jgi:ABC-type glycerol-3-phosphate transport system substrate-binding protein